MPDAVLTRDLDAAWPVWAAHLPAATLALLAAYAEQLWTWSAKMDLISPAERPTLASRYLASALPAVVLCRALPHRRLADIGSGAGIPGVLLACALPDTDVLLLESRRKRAHFLRHLVRQLPLPNAQVIHGRAEEWAATATDRLDLITARSVARPAVLFRLIGARLAPWGALLVSHPAGDALPALSCAAAASPRGAPTWTVARPPPG
jgi:16S rRNA (guanine527-N7)-methyltransferase